MRIIITMSAGGQVQVHGPLDNKVLMYGLLELAREIVAEHGRRAAEAAGGIEQPSPELAKQLLVG